MKSKLDFSKFKHIRSSDNATTLRHPAGHLITIAHAPLSKDNQTVLKALAQSDQTPEQADEARQQKMAEGGQPDSPAAIHPDREEPGYTMAQGGKTPHLAHTKEHHGTISVEMSPQRIVSSLSAENNGNVGGTIRDGSRDEIFVVGNMIFHVAPAKKISDGKSNCMVTCSNDWSEKINVEEDHAIKSESPNPVLIAQIPTEQGLKPLLFDGHHRMYKAMSDGKNEINGYMFTPEESLSILSAPPDLMYKLRSNLKDHRRAEVQYFAEGGKVFRNGKDKNIHSLMKERQTYAHGTRDVSPSLQRKKMAEGGKPIGANEPGTNSTSDAEFAYHHGLPCLNPSCKSHGKPHPNCRCYTRMAKGGPVAEGKIHYCATGMPHHKYCEYYADGGTTGLDPDPDKATAAQKGLNEPISDQLSEGVKRLSDPSSWWASGGKVADKNPKLEESKKTPLENQLDYKQIKRDYIDKNQTKFIKGRKMYADDTGEPVSQDDSAPNVSDTPPANLQADSGNDFKTHVADWMHDQIDQMASGKTTDEKHAEGDYSDITGNKTGAEKTWEKIKPWMGPGWNNGSLPGTTQAPQQPAAPQPDTNNPTTSTAGDQPMIYPNGQPSTAAAAPPAQDTPTTEKQTATVVPAVRPAATPVNQAPVTSADNGMQMPAGLTPEQQNIYKQAYQAQYNQNLQEHAEEDAKFAHDIANGHIQPKTFQSMFGNAGTWGKLKMIAGLVLGSYDPAGMGNGYVNAINRTIKNDLDAQIQSKQNAQNLLRINQAAAMNKANVKQLDAETALKTQAWTQTQMNWAHLNDLVKDANDPQLTPQERNKRQLALTVMLPQIQNMNGDIKAKAAAAAAAIGAAREAGGNNPANLQTLSALTSQEPIKNLADLGMARNVPGIGNFNRPVDEKARAVMNGHKVLRNTINDLKANIDKYATLNPYSAERARGEQEVLALQSKLRDQVLGTVYREKEQPLLDKFVSLPPSSILDYRSKAQLNELNRINDRDDRTFQSQYDPVNKPQSTPKASKQTIDQAKAWLANPKNAKDPRAKSIRALIGE